MARKKNHHKYNNHMADVNAILFRDALRGERSKKFIDHWIAFGVNCWHFWIFPVDQRERSGVVLEFYCFMSISKDGY
jgi:hypothetical protein